MACELFTGDVSKTVVSLDPPEHPKNAMGSSRNSVNIDAKVLFLIINDTS
jgi:hypothetical protein